jgi:hypothetical protein
MKFLSKRADSQILLENLVYNNNADNNRRIRDLLMAEQFNFCAYTEKYLQPLDAVEVEHFNSAIKNTGKDGYYNYYAVIRVANIYKKDEAYANATFFQSLFFQDDQALNTRIGFANNIYYEIDENDAEARDFIDFLGLNDSRLAEQRAKHVKRLKETFTAAGFSDEQIINHFTNNKEELSHLTAIEREFNMNLTELIKNN